jgi:hypothetical protein
MHRLVRLVPAGLLIASAIGGCASSASAPPSTTVSSASAPPSTTVSPPTATAREATPPVAESSPRPLPDDLPTPAGSYVLAADRLYGVPPLDITFTIPSDGWVSWGPGVLTNEPDGRDHVGIGFHNVANLYKDPCLWQTSGEARPRVGPTVADLEDAFARQPHFTASAPTDVTVDGFRGSFMTMTIDADLDFAGCNSGQVHSWIDPDGNSRYYAGPGQVEQFWIVDVDGTRLVIEGSFFPDAPPANLTDLEKIVESIEIEP